MMAISRRALLVAGASAVSRALGQGQGATAEIGVDAGSVGQNKWTPAQFLGYLARLEIRVASVSIPRETLAEEAAVRQIREHADRLGIKLLLSGSSICPASKSFNPKYGTPEEQIATGLRASRILGARAMRVTVGGAPERPQIELHMESTLRVVRGMRSRILDSGIKLAVENHGGDFQARELKALVEEAGRDVLGVCLDSGNPAWMMEDPHLTLELLGPYTEVTHIRDTALWRVPGGVAARWVNMGEGNVDIDGWIRKFIQMKPGVPLIFENLVSASPRMIRIFDAETWKNFQKMPAWELSRFLALAEKGKPVPAVQLPPGKSRGEQQCEDLEGCVRYLRKLLASG
jgi:sugar phosphate isomerase/epimerase